MIVGDSDIFSASEGTLFVFIITENLTFATLSSGQHWEVYNVMLAPYSLIDTDSCNII
jgi:hypothetical protein